MKKLILLIVILGFCGCEKKVEQKVCDKQYINNLVDNLISKVADEDMSFAYYDIANDFYVGFKDEDVYYAASTIKLVNALYIYTLARDTKIDLNTFIDKETIRELVAKMILFSDNNAHQKMVKYLGKGNIQKFGKDLGAVNILIGDNYGNINAKEGIIYLKALYNYLQVEDSYSDELYDLFLRADVNYNLITQVNFLHKYGHYQVYFNDLAIYDLDKPYLTVFLSKYGQKDFKGKIEYFYNEIYDFYQSYNNYIVNNC